MKKIIKKSLALVLSMVMLLTSVPNFVISSHAEDVYKVKVKNSGYEYGGIVLVDNPEQVAEGEVYLSCIPKPGYKLVNYVLYSDSLTFAPIDGNKLTVPASIAEGDVYVGAIFEEVDHVYLQSETVKQLDRIADILELTGSDKEDFKEFVATNCDKNINGFTNGYEFLLRLIEPLHRAYYDKDYLNLPTGLFNDEYYNDFTIDNYDKTYMKDVAGLYLFSYMNELMYLDDFLSSELTYTDLHDAFASFIYGVTEENDETIKNAFRSILNCETWVIQDLNNTKIDGSVLVKEAVEELSPINRVMQTLDRFDKYHDWNIVVYKDNLDRIDMWLQGLINRCILDTSTPDEDEKYFILNDVVSVNAFDEWVNEKEHFDSFTTNKVTNLSEHITELKTSVSGMENDFEKTKAQWKIMNKCALDIFALYDSVFYEGTFDAYYSLLTYDLGDDIMDMVDALDTDRSSDLFNYDETFEKFITSYERLLSVFNGQVWSAGDADVSAIANYYDSLKDELYILNQPVPTSSGSKKYSAKDTNDTAEKISGSGKKGSTRTITPLEGKKVGKVTVTDKQGNKVDVTMNEDGTYSFIQPASNVTVEVTYVNREITLNIGSTKANVDGEESNLDVCPVIRNDRTMLPIRFVAENLGAKVEWNEKNPDTVLITRGDIKIEITLGSDIMKVNGKEVKLDSIAFAENDRTYLPVRAISENLNAIVEWNEARPMEVKIYER